ncbi:hypothetical protein AAEO57_09835 [Flavobacterium sp. DGU38]|uniref:AAA domain-containing protein n=1 Tax=Flavobacterium calami TaxID=3139144 RepID=A0ABU9INR0_9FLAO
MQEYIVLPSITSLTVENYSLYSKSWNYTVKSGLNLFIGVNGLGKTTSTSLIIYGLVGQTTKYNTDKEEFKFIFDNKGNEQKFKINNQYFKNREFEGEKNDLACIVLEFYLNNDLVKIKRNLFVDEIISFEVNGVLQERNYEEYILEKSKLTKISDLAFILEKFLVKEEESNYLLWDVQEQSRILQLLLSPIGFKDKYQKKLNDLSKITTIEKQASYSKTKSLKEQIKNFKEKKRLDENKKYNIQDLKIQDKKLDDEIKELSLKKENIFSSWAENKKEISKIDSQRQGLSFEIEEDSNKLSNLESIFYNKVYTDEKVNTAIHKLNNHDMCIYCDEKVKQDVKVKINEKLKLSCCPVCDSKLGKTNFEEKLVNKSTDEILKDISEIETILREKRKIFHLLSTQKNSMSDLNLNELTIDIDKQIDNKKQVKFKLALDINNIEIKKEVSYWDALIHELEEEVRVIEKQTEEDKKKAIGDSDLKSVSGDIKSLNEELTIKVKENLEALNLIFKELSTQYFKPDGKLVTKSELITKTNNFGEIKQEVYAPFFDNKDRIEIKALSTSERLFLEYIFRLSLLKLYEKNSKNKTFMIMETSEGSFDFEHTRKLAELFTSFNNEDNSLILILNLSKEDFIKKLASNIKKDDRILKFYEFARFENVSKKSEIETKLSQWLR